MNRRLAEAGRKLIYESLVKFNEDTVEKFKWLYSGGNRSLSVEEILNKLPDEGLSNVLDQIDRTLKAKEYPL